MAALDGGEVQSEMTDQIGDHRPAQPVVGVQPHAPEHRQPALVDPREIVLQPFQVLAVTVPDHADGGRAQADQIAVGVGAVALEVPVQGAGLLRQRQLVVGLGEMVHADVDVTGVGQPPDGGFENRQLHRRRRQSGRVDLALGFEQVRQMGVVERRNPVGALRDDVLHGPAEAGDALQRQAVDQIHADRFEAFAPSGVHHLQRDRAGLDAVDRLLHLGIEILHSQAQAIETQFPQQGDGAVVGLARIDFDGILAAVVVEQAELLAGDPHQLAHFGGADEGGRAAAPVQLRDGPRPVEQRALQRDFPVQVVEIRNGVAAVLGDDLVAGAVKADRVAERNVDIQRQRFAGGVAGQGQLPILGGGEALVKLHGGRVGGVAGAGLVVLADQGGIENDAGIHERSESGGEGENVDEDSRMAGGC